MLFRSNARLDTPFWRHCQSETDLSVAAPIVEHYGDCGPAALWEQTLFNPADPFKLAGYAALLVGQKVPYRRQVPISQQELRQWEALRQRHQQIALRSLTIPEALSVVRSPSWKWNKP